MHSTHSLIKIRLRSESIFSFDSTLQCPVISIWIYILAFPAVKRIVYVCVCERISKKVKASEICRVSISFAAKVQ